MPPPEEMNIIDIYNAYLSELRTANTTQKRAEVANLFLNEVWRGGDTSRKYAKYAAEYSYAREQLEKAADRICVTHDEAYALRRSIYAVCILPQMAAIADNEDALSAIIKMGAAVYMSRTKPGRFINYINTKLPAALTYGQASLLIDNLFYGGEIFPKSLKPDNSFNVLLALMIKCGREVRRTHKRYERDAQKAAEIKIIKHDETMLKAVIFALIAFYISFLIKLLLGYSQASHLGDFKGLSHSLTPHGRP